MKFSLVALAATLAVVNAANCDVSKIAPLITDPSVATCTSDSGFSFTAPSVPTGEALTKVCASKACQTVLTAVKNLNLGDCTVLGIQLETDLLNPISKGCASGSSSTTAGSSAGSKASSATVTTPAPAATTSGSTSGSSASSSTIKTPSTTSTPAPTATKSAASAVTVAASAAVIAVAAAFM